MTKNQCDQIARIITEVFQHEQSIAPETIVLMFKLIGNLLVGNDKEIEE